VVTAAGYRFRARPDLTGPLIEVAKLGILLASLTAGVIGLLVGRVLLPSTRPREGARTLAEAEGSTVA
jgi:hypothetical protein